MRNNEIRKRGVRAKTPILPFWGLKRTPYRSLIKVSGWIEISDIKICVILSIGFNDPDVNSPVDTKSDVVFRE
jgi:hypothetical protein